MTVLLVLNQSKPEATSVALQAAAILQSVGVHVVSFNIQKNIDVLQKANITLLSEKDAFSTCDIVVTIGGDGTMLHTARETLKWQKPMVGINIGHLGFLTLIENNELEKLKRLITGDYYIENRTVLLAKAEGEHTFEGMALNDVVMFKAEVEKTISLHIYCDDIRVSRFRGDGIVFSTPTGSTAYSMSAGGPIVDVQLGGIIATQICAHVVHTPPMVFAPNRALCAKPQNNEPIAVSLDGMPSIMLSPGQNLTITQASNTVPMIQFYDASQLKSIDKKLKGR